MGTPAPASITVAATPRAAVGLPWLTRLRWGAVAGQLVTVLVARFALGLPIPLAPLMALVAVTAATNLAAIGWLRHRGADDRLAGGLLAVDTVLLTAMLHLTGGPLNPFSILYLVHITLAAVILGARWTWLLAALAVASYAVLFFASVPLDLARGHHEGAGLSLHLQGMWWAFCVATGLTAYFVVKLSKALETRDAEIAEVRERAARNERLASLTTLAAGAAHELGTPLGTIAVASREIERALARLPPESAGPLLEDARLIRSELQRCRRILDEMAARAGENAGEDTVRVPLSSLMAEGLAALSTEQAARVDVVADLASVEVFGPRQALGRAVGSLLKNALDATGPDQRVTLTAFAEGGRIRLVVKDPGPGIAPELLARLGEPFVSTKPPGAGMGLGLFLARTLAEGLGGRLVIESSPGRGTAAALELPAPTAL
jgi:two-component system, sensor histidine kinase RegB